MAAPDGNFPHDWGGSANIVSYIVPPLVLSCGTYISYIPPSPPSTCRCQSDTLSALDQRSQMAPTLAFVRMARRWPFTDCLEESVRGWSPARISRFRDVLKQGKVCNAGGCSRPVSHQSYTPPRSIAMYCTQKLLRLKTVYLATCYKTICGLCGCVEAPNHTREPSRSCRALPLLLGRYLATSAVRPRHSVHDSALNLPLSGAITDIGSSLGQGPATAPRRRTTTATRGRCRRSRRTSALARAVWRCRRRRQSRCRCRGRQRRAVAWRRWRRSSG